MALLLTACAGEAATTPPAPTATPAPETTPVPVQEEPAIEPEEEDLAAKGEEIFQQTAGGTGCAVCHGKDASGNIGPDIRGKSVADIQDALSFVDAMSSISLKDVGIRAVAAYLQTISR